MADDKTPPHRSRWWLRAMRVYLVILLAAAIVLLVGGVELLRRGGSAYYVICGGMLAASAVLLWRRDRTGLWLFAALFLGTLMWAVWEVGFNAWALVPRISFLAIAAIALLVLRRRVDFGGTGRGMAVEALLAILSLALFGTAIIRGDAAHGVAAGRGVGRVELPADAEWQAFGGAPAGTQFSGLDEIRLTNVAKLKVAWVYKLDPAYGQGLEATPLKVADSLYFCTNTNLVIALDASTGRERWRQDALRGAAPHPRSVCRGVTYNRVPDANGACAERIFTNTGLATLVALDARTGRRCTGFGKEGEVSLLAGMQPTRPGLLLQSSAPTMAAGRIVVGGSAMSLKGSVEPSGVVRAFDAVTGALAWSYDVGHPDRVLLKPGEFYTAGTPNAWAPMTYDASTGLVYVPTASNGPSYYGPRRRSIDEEISTSILALDAATGRRRWMFQTVHHDLWDYDVGSQPIMIDFPVGGRYRAGLLQPTKRGEIFVLDRATGEPLDPIAERRVPQTGAVPGERLSPTQPFPTGLPSLAGGTLRETDMWGVSPFDQLWCRIQFRKARYKGPMTPPGLTPSIQYPGWAGGANWGGAAIDVDHDRALVVTNYLANYVQMQRVSDSVSREPKRPGDLGEIAGRPDAPYTLSNLPFLSPLGVPCQQPPWSRLSMIDLRQRKLIWSRPLGTGKDLGPMGLRSRLPLTMGVPAVGGILVTRGGLTFVAASTDRTFRAFETASGQLVWQSALPLSGNATPITFRDRGGRQLVVIAAGGHAMLGAGSGGSIIAYAL